jgi:dihydrofolate reductase
VSRHFKVIAAMSLNRVIGCGNKIPWHLPEDFKWFKRMTTGNVVVMGRKTFESLKGALPNRTNLVLTRNPRRLIKTQPEVFGQFKEWRGGAKLKRSYQMSFTRIENGRMTDLRLCDSLDLLDPMEFLTDIFICGGAEIYAQMLPRCSDLYLTVVKKEYEGDAFFPEFEHLFTLQERIAERPEFEIRHYHHRSLQ